MNNAGAIIGLGVAGLLAYFLLRQPATAATGTTITDPGFTPYSGGKPFDWLSVNPVVASGSTAGGYQPPVFGTPVLPGLSGTHLTRRGVSCC